MSRLAIGLISGTSLDGIDSALVSIEGAGTATVVEEIAYTCLPYPSELREELLEVSAPGGGSVDRICLLDVVIGEWFARAALAVCEEGDVKPEQVAFLGSHGQTVHHLPEAQHRYGVDVRATLQLGCPAVIAERTGITTVADFRSRDMAAGGQGAPLVPMVDYLLFRAQNRSRAMVNIGGIANVTLLGAGTGPEQVVAFDTGPGNMVLDALMTQFSSGAESFDRNGARAGRGRVAEDVLRDLLRDPYLELRPPKSTGREAYGVRYVADLLTQYRRLTEDDLLRTVTEFTACTIADAIDRYGPPGAAVSEVYVSGGGARNRTLMKALAARIEGAHVDTLDALGIGPDRKEAIAFAVLANETLAGAPGNLPSATGASRPVVLGTITPADGSDFSGLIR